MKSLRIILAASAILGGSCFAFAQENDAMSNVERFGRVMVYLHNNYIDTVNFTDITNHAIQEVMDRLDPHSVFIPKEEVESTNESLNGSFDGIGIEFAVISDTLCVQNVIVGGPSQEVGLLSGDKILSIDGENVAGIGLTTDGVRKRLRGPKGTKVELGVRRHGVDEPLEFTITRNKIPLHSVDAAYCPLPGVFYVKLSSFSQNSVREFIDAIKQQCEKMPEGIIFDLRGNGGGYMHVATMLANIFLEGGQTIVYTEGRHSPLKSEKANNFGFFKEGALVVLVDEGSASASEIFAGAMQDWDRGVIVGRRTFGKGLVQQQFPLSDGSQIRLTVSRYHTPSGRVIQTPYENGHREEYYNKLSDRYNNGEFFNRDSIQFPDSLKYKTLKLGRTVYGGGGIMPDVFIASDTTGVNDFFSAIIRKGYLTEYANKYIDSHRSELVVEGRSFEDFYKAYGDMEPEAFAGLLNYCSERGLKPSESQLSQCEKLLKTRLKAIIARTPFNTTGYYRVINLEEDPAFRKALEIISDWQEPFPSL